MSSADLAHDIAQYIDDPLGFVLYAFPWGEPNTPLEKYPDGPDKWHIRLFNDISEQVAENRHRVATGQDMIPVQMAIASGHGIGKGHPVDMPYNNGVWGDLNIGDEVFNAQGEPTKIKAVRRYKREHYKVTFADGS